MTVIYDVYKITLRPETGKPTGCIRLIESPDDGYWWAIEYDFTRDDNPTKFSTDGYRTRESLVYALDRGIVEFW